MTSIMLFHYNLASVFQNDLWSSKHSTCCRTLNANFWDDNRNKRSLLDLYNSTNIEKLNLDHCCSLFKNYWKISKNECFSVTNSYSILNPMFNIRPKIWITGIWRCFRIFYIYDIIAKSFHEKKGFKIYFHQQMNWNLAFLISVLKAKPTNTLSKLGFEDKILYSTTLSISPISWNE